ncbi:MAG: PEP-CTERM sorting domain-containing protein [Kiritimatiellales bacterium]|nr:PEP-CTERM sorting domain-containing protein [Kiritimatiellales bacterium]
MTSSSLQSAVIVVALVLGITAPTQAVLVQNVTTDTAIFYDNFESLGSSVSHTAFEDTSGDYDPVATIGSWYVKEDFYNARTAVQVTDSTTSPDPGAYPYAQGDNYLRFVRYPGTTNTVEGNFAATQSTTGDQLHFEWMMNVTADDGTQNPYTGFLTDNNTLMTWVSFLHDGTIENSYSTTPNTGLNYTPGEWFKLEMDYVIGESVYDLTIDGVTASDLDLYGDLPAGESLAKLRFFGNVGDLTYVDAVPEPNTVMLVVMGLAGLISRRRRT